MYHSGGAEPSSRKIFPLPVQAAAICDPLKVGRKGIAFRYPLGWHGAGPAVGLWGDRPLGLSALPWSVEALTAADHAHLLAPDGRVHVHLDVAHRGLGTAACGPDTADRHRPRPARHRWTWWLAPR